MGVSHAFTAFRVMAVGLASASRAADPASMAPSLALTPANVAFYSASLRAGDQIDRFMNSKAYAALRDLPAVQHAIKHFHEEANKPGSDAAKFLKVWNDPANRDLVAMLREGFRREFFFYGGANWGDFAHIAMEINAANQFTPLVAMMKGENPQQAQVKSVIEVLKNSGNKLQVPESVFGMRRHESRHGEWAKSSGSKNTL